MESVFTDPVLWGVAGVGLALVAYVLLRVGRRLRQGGEGAEKGKRRSRRRKVLGRGTGATPRRPIRSDEEWERWFRSSITGTEGSGGDSAEPERAASREPEPSAAASEEPARKEPARSGPAPDEGPRTAPAPHRPVGDGSGANGTARSAPVARGPRPHHPTSNGARHNARPATKAERANGNGSHVSRNGDFLPGRLLPLEGWGAHVRFARLDGRNRFTLGRDEGAEPGHVQIPVPSVSAIHAAMEFADGRWFLTNRSATDPVHLNGAPLDGAESHPLRDGDRIDMGEASFLFRKL